MKEEQGKKCLNAILFSQKNHGAIRKELCKRGTRNDFKMHTTRSETRHKRRWRRMQQYLSISIDAFRNFLEHIFLKDSRTLQKNMFICKHIKEKRLSANSSPVFASIRLIQISNGILLISFIQTTPTCFDEHIISSNN